MDAPLDAHTLESRLFEPLAWLLTSTLLGAIGTAFFPLHSHPYVGGAIGVS